MSAGGAGERSDAIEGTPLPAELSRLPAGRHGLPPEFIRENQRTRILAAALEVFGTRGFAETTVQDLIREARVSRATFYAVFSDKEDCFLALYDTAVSWLRGEAVAAGREEADWAGRLCAVTERIVSTLAGDRRLARVCAVEAPSAGEAALGRREELGAEVAEAMRAGRAERPWGPRLPSSLEIALLGGGLFLIAKGPALGRDVEPETLAGELSELLLTPYLGMADARALVRSREG